MSTVKPRVYVSSTVYDFADLRSAVKFWLDEKGFEVLLSEFNDFPVPPEKNSYQACLDAIETCDFFVLLIGGRVGGWFDQNERVSITRMEYRKALEFFRSNGRPKLLVFVRNSIWDIREDRSALRQALEQSHCDARELPEEERAKIINHPSKLVTDADTVFDFISEIGQVQKMKAASEGSGRLPEANWIHRFSGFEDIANGLQVGLAISKETARLILEANLTAELLTNMAELCIKDKNAVMPLYAAGIRACNQAKGDLADVSQVDATALKGLATFAVLSASPNRRISTRFIDEAISSGHYLEFDHTTATFRVGDLQQALLDLRFAIDELARLDKVFTFTDRIDWMDKHRAEWESSGQVPMQNGEVALVGAHVSRHKQVFECCIIIYLTLTSGPEHLKRMPRIRKSIEVGGLSLHDDDEVTREDMLEWLESAQRT